MLQVRTSPELPLRQPIIIIFLLALSVFIFFNLPRGALKEITINNAGEQLVIKTSARTVRQVLNHASITVGTDDLVIPSMDTVVKNGESIRIVQAESVKLVVDGMEREIAVPILEEASILVREGIILGPEDRVVSNLGTDSTDLFIRVVRVRTTVVREVAQIPYNTVYRPDGRFYHGLKKVLVTGDPGLARKTILVTYEDDKPVKSDILTDEEFRAPQAQVVAYGTRSRPAMVARYGASRSARMIKVIATAYTHTGNRTATGLYPKVGTVAVDPAVIPLGTKIFVEGYGEGVAQDTGGRISGNRIDVFFDTYDEAIRWGKKTVNIYIY